MKSLWIAFDYGVLLPLLSFLPPAWGRTAAAFRGYVYGLLKRDWRSFTFGDDALWERTYRAYEAICPDLSHAERLKLVHKRYVYQSIEEFEGVLLDKNKFGTIHVDYLGIENVEALLRENPHAVFVTSHFGSSLLGITFLQRLNVPLLVMSSDVVSHPRVHPTLTQFFLKKYKGISNYMNGGEVLDIEGNGKKFLSFLKKTGSLVIIADLPPNSANEAPAWKMFFGKERGFAAGAQKLAVSTSSVIIPFVCYFEKDRYVLQFGDANQDPYRFLEAAITKRPQMWWAADILGLLPTKEA